MDKAKNVDPDSITSQGHRIFVPLGSKDNKATTKILLVEGTDFAVLDYDGTSMTIWFEVIYACLSVVIRRQADLPFQGNRAYDVLQGTGPATGSFFFAPVDAATSTIGIPRHR